MVIFVFADSASTLQQSRQDWLRTVCSSAATRSPSDDSGDCAKAVARTDCPFIKSSAFLIFTFLVTAKEDEYEDMKERARERVQRAAQQVLGRSRYSTALPLPVRRGASRSAGQTRAPPRGSSKERTFTDQNKLSHCVGNSRSLLFCERFQKIKKCWNHLCLENIMKCIRIQSFRPF